MVPMGSRVQEKRPGCFCGWDGSSRDDDAGGGEEVERVESEDEGGTSPGASVVGKDRGARQKAAHGNAQCDEDIFPRHVDVGEATGA